MLGPARFRRLDRPIAVSEAKLDLTFVREWSRELYAERGRPSIDPAIFFTLQLVMVFEGIRSERQLIATAGLNLAHRWYLGYALDEHLPDPASLTRIRPRLGIDVVQQFFEWPVTTMPATGVFFGLNQQATRPCQKWLRLTTPGTG